MSKRIESALISVFYKDGLRELVHELHQRGVAIYSTGGTQAFIEGLGIPVIGVEELTNYPSIFGGRVKTLHPKVFGGILYRRDHEADLSTAEQYAIPAIDMVIVDLYPFEETVRSGAGEEDIIEKIDIGGISLIRGAAKNFKDVWIVSHKRQYQQALEILETEKNTLENRRKFAKEAYEISSGYDSAIYAYFSGESRTSLISPQKANPLRYGENPHQKATFYGDLNQIFDQISGKELSYNNLLDVEACVRLIDEFEDTTAVIVKHNNACGVASHLDLRQAYLSALASDPVSAFGGVIAVNRPIDMDTAEELHKLFFEILIAPEFKNEAAELLQKKKDRRLLVRKEVALPQTQFRTLLNGVLEQEKDLAIETRENFRVVTDLAPNEEQLRALEFALKVCKHLKSNNVVLADPDRMLACGVGQTSRVDALNQAIENAQKVGFDLKGAVMASEAFFPFPDCVEIAYKAGINAVVQPGGSIKDQLSVDYCNANGIAMVMTGVRHFLH